LASELISTTIQEAVSPTDSRKRPAVLVIERKSRIKHVLVLPAILFFVALTIFPLLFTFFISFNQWFLVGERVFVGVANYLQLFSDVQFLNSLKVTMVFTIVAVAVEYALGLGLALLVSDITRGRKFIRLSILLPMMMTPFVVGIIWKMIYHPTYGPIDGVLTRLGLPTIPFINSQELALPSMILADVWQWTPFVFLIMIAAVGNLPQEPFESARVDGASGWRLFRDLTFPMLMPATMGVLLIRAIEAFKIFDIIFATTIGGPGGATNSYTMWAYTEGWRAGNLSYSAAITFTMLIITMAVTMAFLAYMRKVNKMESAAE
jgi:multiple sugar transport system permease protein